MQIKVTTANVLHTLMILGQVLNFASGAVPTKWQPVVAGVLALVQMGIGRLQHQSPPPVKQ
jgi:hypothetical protein